VSTKIYHITHVRNLPQIIAEGGLCCDNERQRRALESIGIAHQHIKNRRARRPIPVGPGGTLADYVPFYFAPHSPMLFAIHKGQVVGYQGGQGEVVHLCTMAEDIAAAGLSFVFSEGHAEMAISDFFSDLGDLDRVDWYVMRATFWNDTAADGDRKRRRQAEFLVHGFVPWARIAAIGVMNQATAGLANEALRGAAHKPEILLRPRWYY